MKFKFQHLEKIIGAFVIVSLLAVFFSVIAIGRGQHWFEKSYPYTTIFEGDAGLKPGSAVQMVGIDIGEVTSVSLNQDNLIEVQFKVQEKYAEKIRSDSVARAASPSLLGGKVLEITVGSPLLSEVEPDSILPSEEGGGIAELLQSPHGPPSHHVVLIRERFHERPGGARIADLGQCLGGGIAHRAARVR